MGLIKIRLGDHIELCLATNADMRYGAEYVRGVNNLKKLMPTKADINGRDLSKFSIVYPGDFVFNHRTSRNGSKFSIAYNDGLAPVICTEDYVVFRVKQDSEQVILAEWLYLYFCRSEFDRYVITNSWGSSTEFYNWEDICDIEIGLPPLPIQQKYVAIYKAMVANQQSYERGLEDLRLVCDGFFDRAKEGKALPLGQLIERVDRRNADNQLGERDVRGITNIKEFSATKADVSDVDLSKFKVVNPGEFAYNSRTDGRDMLVLALNRESGPIMVTFNYNVFRVRDKAAGIVCAEYLYAYFKRAEFDRRVRFCSWGSSQELLTWDNLCEMSIPVPSIEEQIALSQIMLSYIERRRLNEQLKSSIRGICPILIKGSLEEAADNEVISV